jgi:hypothetical protein
MTMTALTQFFARRKSTSYRAPDKPAVVYNHLEFPFEPEDYEAARRLSWTLGSLELDKEHDSPELQWRTVARALRMHGMRIVQDIRHGQA